MKIKINKWGRQARSVSRPSVNRLQGHRRRRRVGQLSWTYLTCNIVNVGVETVITN